MPLDGNGGYNPPSPENPVRAGTLIKSEEFNTTIDDIADALSTAFYRDGQAPIEADLDMGHHSLLRVKAVRNDEPMTISTNSTLNITAGSGRVENITGNSTETITGAAVQNIGSGFTQNIEGNSTINITGALSIEAPDGTLLNSDLTVNSITLQDGAKVEAHTAIGGVGQNGKSVITDSNGIVNISLMPFTPTQDTSYKVNAGTALNAGDFIYIDGNNLAQPCINNPSFKVVGFVLQDYNAGAVADVYFQGFNNQVEIEGETTNDQIVYVDIYQANKVRYSSNGGQMVGVVVGNRTIRFMSAGGSTSTLARLLYFSGR